MRNYFGGFGSGGRLVQYLAILSSTYIPGLIDLVPEKYCAINILTPSVIMTDSPS